VVLDAEPKFPLDEDVGGKQQVQVLGHGTSQGVLNGHYRA